MQAEELPNNIEVYEPQAPEVPESNINAEKKCKCSDSFQISQSEQLTGMKVKDQESKNSFLPLKELNVDVEIQDSIALITMVQEYINPCKPSQCDEHQP